jgi:hypothetical protein
MVLKGQFCNKLSQNAVRGGTPCSPQTYTGSGYFSGETYANSSEEATGILFFRLNVQKMLAMNLSEQFFSFLEVK